MQVVAGPRPRWKADPSAPAPPALACATSQGWPCLAGMEISVYLAVVGGDSCLSRAWGLAGVPSAPIPASLLSSSMTTFVTWESQGPSCRCVSGAQHSTGAVLVCSRRYMIFESGF